VGLQGHTDRKRTGGPAASGGRRSARGSDANGKRGGTTSSPTQDDGAEAPSDHQHPQAPGAATRALAVQKEKEVVLVVLAEKARSKTFAFAARMSVSMFPLLLLTALGYRSSGCVEGNCVFGRGVWHAANRDMYDGEWKDGNKNGRGIYTYARGDRVECSWDDDQLHGKECIYTEKQGSQYQGEYKEGARSGRGIYVAGNGAKYDGDFRFGKEHGMGTLVDANGDKYTGDFSFGKAHGKGTRTFPNGSVFKGQFRFGVENGEGTLTVRGAAVHDAQWIRAKSGNVLIASCGAIFSCILAPQQPLSLPLLQQKKTQREN
jgi:hypothetical protein